MSGDGTDGGMIGLLEGTDAVYRDGTANCWGRWGRPGCLGPLALGDWDVWDHG